MVPAEDQAMVLPWASVMVIMVLLKVALTWAMPELIFLRSRRRGLARVAVCVSFAIDHRAPGIRVSIAKVGFRRPGRGLWRAPARLSGGLLFAGNGPRLALARARIGVRALAADRQAAAVPQTAVAAQIHQALDVHGDVAAQVTLHHVVAIDRLADLQDLRVGQVIDPALVGNADLAADLLRELRADAVNVLKRDDDALLRRNVNACDTSHAGLLKDRTLQRAHAVAAKSDLNNAQKNAHESAPATVRQIRLLRSQSRKLAFF